MISPEKCIGCRSCELACSFGKIGQFNPKQSAVSVISFDDAAVSVPVMCMQCEEPTCVKVCPNNAISRDENGAVSINEEKCMVCKLCASACLLGNITFNSIGRKMLKCDLCGGTPGCVDICPSGAIEYKEGSYINLRKKKLIAEKFKELFGEVDE